MKQILITNLIKSDNDKYDNLINIFLPIKRARLIYKYFGIISINN
jgi:hypothetical protein